MTALTVAWGLNHRKQVTSRLLFTFDTTHHALWAEEIAGERGIPNEIVPAPPEAHARCNLALEILPVDAVGMERALEEEGVPFGIHHP